MVRPERRRPDPGHRPRSAPRWVGCSADVGRRDGFETP